MFTERLKQLREQRGLNQTQLSEKLNISRVNYNRYEKGDRFPDQDTLLQISNFYNVSLDYLLGKNKIHTPPPPQINQPTLQLSSEELAIIEKYRKMDESKKDTLFRVAEHLEPNIKPEAAGK